MKKIFIVLSMLLFVGCEQTQLTRTDGNRLASQLSYFKDYHGVCYATLASVTYSTYAVVTITAVPCDKVGL